MTPAIGRILALDDLLVAWQWSLTRPVTLAPADDLTPTPSLAYYVSLTGRAVDGWLSGWGVRWPDPFQLRLACFSP